jgi:DNA-binding MurR/RpiR family transcriptional regulator
MTLRQLRTQGTQVILLTNAPDGGLSQAATLVLATSQLGDDSEEAYVFDPVFPVQLLTMRALVAATIAARKMQ